MLPLDYSWFDAFLDLDSFIFDDVLNWEESINFLIEDLGLFFFLTFFFANTIILFDSIVKFSTLDTILYLDFSSTSSIMLSFFLDSLLQFQNSSIFTNALLISEYQDVTSSLLYLDPTLTLGLEAYLSDFWESLAFSSELASIYDSFSDVMGASIPEYLNFFLLFFFFLLWTVFFFSWASNSLPTSWYNFTFGRIYKYLASLASENRVQLDVLLQVGFLFLLFWSMTLMVFDDDFGEIIGLIDSTFFTIFLTVITFLIYRYSIHLFSFLEASDVSGRSLSFILKQFFRDFMGALGLFLRFFILIFRLNVYDNLDDLLESYYIVVCDFDDDLYFSDFFFVALNKFFFMSGFEDDRLLSLENELDSYVDFYVLFFALFTKMVFFLFFIFEEIFRVGLALYISYLIVFEVHASNSSYSESNSTFKK